MVESLFPSKNVKSTHQTKRNHLCMNQIHSHSTNAKLSKEQIEYKETHFGGPKTSSLAPGCLRRRGKRKEKAGLLVSLNTFHWQDLSALKHREEQKTQSVKRMCIRSRKMVLTNIFAGQEWRSRYQEWTCGHRGERSGGANGERSLETYIFHGSSACAL